MADQKLSALTLLVTSAAGDEVYIRDISEGVPADQSKRITIASLFNVPAGTQIKMNGDKIATVGDPTSAQDAATKNYVDVKDREIVRFTGKDGIFAGANPAGSAARNAHEVLTFDDTVDESIIFEGIWADNYRGGNINVDIQWLAASATSGTVQWDTQFERIDAGGLDIDADSFAAAQTVTGTPDGTNGVTTLTTKPFVFTQIDGLTASDAFRIKITRNTSVGGNMVGDAQILRVKIRQI